MSALKVAKLQLREYEDELKRHMKGCMACTRARTDGYTRPCPGGERLDTFITFMSRQVELLSSPPQPEYVQEELW